jgi:hypothetical protein
MKCMKFTLVRCGAALLTATDGKPAMAQFTGPDAYNKNAVSKVMRDDPAVATQIRQNPSLLNDPAYMRTHPNLSNFVAKNPSAGALPHRRVLPANGRNGGSAQLQPVDVQSSGYKPRV